MALAQELALPAFSYFEQTSGTALTWRTSDFHFQVIYDTSHFQDQGVTGPILIQRLRFRAAPDGVNDPGGSIYPAVTIELSSCPLNYSAASTTFANNRGADNQVCFTGPVVTLPSLGGTPNDHFIDVALTNPFVYDPLAGSDLVIEVDGVAPSGPVPTAAARSFRSRRISAASSGASTGTSSASASAILIDFSGSGGYATWTRASANSNGTGCYQTAVSFYEDFQDLSLFDLANQTLTMTPNASGGYAVALGGPTAFYPHGTTHLGLTDDDVSVVGLPSSFGTGFPFPTGAATATIGIGSNGHVFLGNDTTAMFPNAQLMLFWPTPQLAPFSCDLLPDTVNNVYFDIAPSGTTVYVTYDAVPTFSAGGVCNLQVAMHANGIVEYRYGSCSAAATDLGVVGWTPGNFAADPGSTDISANPTFSTSGPDQLPLTLFSTVPYLGSTLLETASNVPANTLFSVRALTVGQLPGIDLGFLGAPGCALWVDLGGTVDLQTSFQTPDADFTLQVPNNTALLGAIGYSQAAAFSPTANAFGMLTSNQIAYVFGNS